MGSKGTQLKPGAAFHCPKCDRDSVIKVVRRMEGWKCVGEELVCAFCQTEVYRSEADSDSCDSGEKVDPGVARLAGFLGQEIRPRQKLTTDEDSHFCRDCRHFLRHPFVSRCLLHDKEVDPMQDCADFAARGGGQSGSKSESREGSCEEHGTSDVGAEKD